MTQPEKAKNTSSTAILIEGGSDIIISGNRIAGYDTAIISRNAQNVHVQNNEIIQSLNSSVPSLPNLDIEQVNELLHLTRSSDSGNLSDSIKNSKIGRWLLQQSFVDWANLAVALIALVGRK